MPIVKKSKEENGPLSLREAVNRMFDERFWFPIDISTPLLGERGDTSPKVDVIETDREIMVTASLPGVDPDAIHIEADENSLRIRGAFEKEHEKKEARAYHYEREYGTFDRIITLPAKVNPGNASAKTKNGVLTVTLPKSEKATQKKISIQKES